MYHTLQGCYCCDTVDCTGSVQAFLIATATGQGQAAARPRRDMESSGGPGLERWVGPGLRGG
jgi:hypothetical protein